MAPIKSDRIRGKSLSELVSYAERPKEEIVEEFIDNHILGDLVAFVSHRMHAMTNDKYDSVRELFDAVTDRIDDWFVNTSYATKEGYKLKCHGVNTVGHLTIKISKGVFNAKRVINLRAYVTPDRLFKSTGENIFAR